MGFEKCDCDLLREIRQRIAKEPSSLLFFSDMDGTLLSNDKTLSKRNMDAIIRLRETGARFIVATGRVIQATRHYFEPMGINDPCILCNGGMIHDCSSNKVMWSRSLDRKIASEQTKELLAAFPDVCAEICTPDGIFDIQINDWEYMHWKLAGFTASIVGSPDDVPDTEWSKILFAMSEQRIPEFAAYCSSIAGADRCEFITSGSIFHEMLPKNCSKGEGLLKLVELYGLDGCITVAMGDYDNDLTMLENADVAACPSNARECIREEADIITVNDSENGSVADVIDTLLFG